MKKIVALVAILVLVTSMSFGQEFVSSQASGAKALLFTWSGLANINATELGAGVGVGMAGIGLKLYMSDYLALRGLLLVDIANQTIPATPPTGWLYKDGENSANLLGIGVAVEFHLSKGRISPYVGGAVIFTTIGTESKDAVTGPGPTAPDQTTVKNDLAGTSVNGKTYYAGTGIGIGALIGAEYYITNGLSLSAEYRIGFLSTSAKDEETSSSTGGTVIIKGGSGSNIAISTAGFLTLAVYL